MSMGVSARTVCDLGCPDVATNAALSGFLVVVLAIALAFAGLVAWSPSTRRTFGALAGLFGILGAAIAAILLVAPARPNLRAPEAVGIFVAGVAALAVGVRICSTRRVGERTSAGSAPRRVRLAKLPPRARPWAAEAT
jgi:hypothetical protein